MINRLICWLFGCRYAMTVVHDYDAKAHKFNVTNIGPCTRCGKE